MPWIIRTQHPDYVGNPSSCPGCAGSPQNDGDGMGSCDVCGAILLCADPQPGEFIRFELIPVDDVTMRPLPNKRRRTIQIRYGDRRQSDGTSAKVYRLVDKANDRYIEKVERIDGVVRDIDEPLTEHQGRGSARQKANRPEE